MSASIADRILFEDNHLLVINKLAGELVQGDKTGDPSLIDVIKAFIKVRDKKPGNVYLGAPHRLDRPTSGIVVFTKTSKALSRMNDLFRRKEVEKIYWAITSSKPRSNSGRLEGWMKKNEKQNKSYVIHAEKEGYKRAVLTYQLLSSGDNYHLIEVILETGRHHQIRAQLADLGCIIKGDLKYGAQRSNPDGSIGLHARSISFIHPVTKTSLEIVASVPNDNLWRHFETSLT